MRFSTIADWLTWQNSLNRTEIVLGLSRCQEVATRLNLLTPSFPVITIAGTNGKGSSVTFLKNILTLSGLKVGSNISPHLFHYNERVSIGQQAVTDQQICEAFSVIDTARGDIPLTAFEFITLAAMWIFHEEKVDIAILEVGLGGRLDAINTFNADIALITPIDIDHSSSLGDNREDISYEKAGICRPNKPVVCTDFSVTNRIKAHSAELNAPLYCQSEEFSYQDEGATWSWQTEGCSYDELPQPSLAGAFQLQNASGVLMVIHLLQQQGFSISLAHIKQGLQQAAINGRFQSLKTEKGVCIFDVAHNPLAAKTLKNNLNESPCTGKTHAVVGMLKDKDSAQVFDILQSCIDTWHLAPLESPRTETADTLAQHISTATTTVSDYPTIKAAYQTIQSQRDINDRVIVFGSFFTVAEALSAEESFL